MDYLQKYLKYKYKYFKLIGGYNKEYKIILTVPHSQPNKYISVGRTHDMKALSFALKLLKLFESYDVEIIISRQSRNICDDNRNNALNNCDKLSSERTYLWEKLIETVQKTDKSKKIIVLDVHSFPNGSFDNNDIAFLENIHHYNAIGRKICDILQQNTSIKCNVYTAAYNMNAIIDNTNNIVHGVSLIEINESLRDIELNQLAIAIYNSIITIME
jgi:hypothetical protein